MSSRTLLLFQSFHSKQSMEQKVFKIQSMYVAAFIPSPLLFALFPLPLYLSLSSSLSLPHSLCISVSLLGVYDEDSQWMMQVNRLQKLIDRLEQKVNSFLLTFPYSTHLPAVFFIILFLCSFHYFYLHQSPCTIPAIWSLHRSLKLTTNHGKWIQNTINKLTQHPPT